MSMNTAVLKHELVRNLMFAPLVSKKFENDAILYNTGLILKLFYNSDHMYCSNYSLPETDDNQTE